MSSSRKWFDWCWNLRSVFCWTNFKDAIKHKWRQPADIQLYSTRRLILGLLVSECRWHHWRCVAFTRQVVSRRSNVNVCLEASRPLGCTLKSVWVQGSVYHTHRQDCRPEYHWCQFNSPWYSVAVPTADLQSRRQPHRWYRSYLVNQTQCVCRGAHRHSSPICRAVCRRDLRPLLFILCTFYLIQVIEGQGIWPHLYVEDTHASGSYRPSNVSLFSSSISDCLRDVAIWMKSNRRRLNSPTNSRTANCVVVFRRTLSVASDSPAYTARHIPDTGGSLVLSRLDSGNGVLVGLPAYLVNKW